MQRKELNEEEATADNNLENYVANLSSGGQTLPDGVRSFCEPRFGYDFSNVRVHTDTVAAESAQSINALAYTSGNNIVFNEGQYSKNTDSGKRLMPHELTHVVQQGTGKVLQQKADKNEANALAAHFHKLLTSEGDEVSEEEPFMTEMRAEESLSQKVVGHEILFAKK